LDKIVHILTIPGIVFDKMLKVLEKLVSMYFPSTNLEIIHQIN